jgi:hypothetical protein
MSRRLFSSTSPLLRLLASCCLALLLLLVVSPAEALQLRLDENQERCISEEADAGRPFTTEFQAVDPSGQNVGVVIRNPDKSIAYEKTASTGRHMFNPTEDGSVAICFRNPLPQRVMVEVIVKSGFDDRKVEDIATKENLKPVEVELRRLENRADTITNELEFLERRTEEQRVLDENSHSRVLFLSFFSMFALVALSGSQIWYLKRFFRSKKLID